MDKEELREKIQKLHDKGFTDAEIGRRLNYSRERIRQIRKGMGNSRKVPIEKKALLRTGEAAQLLGVTEITIRRWADKGILPVAFRLGPREDRRFRRADIEKFKVRQKAREAIDMAKK